MKQILGKTYPDTDTAVAGSHRFQGRKFDMERKVPAVAIALIFLQTSAF